MDRHDRAGQSSAGPPFLSLVMDSACEGGKKGEASQFPPNCVHRRKGKLWKWETDEADIKKKQKDRGEVV